MLSQDDTRWRCGTAVGIQAPGDWSSQATQPLRNPFPPGPLGSQGGPSLPVSGFSHRCSSCLPFSCSFFVPFPPALQAENRHPPSPQSSHMRSLRMEETVGADREQRLWKARGHIYFLNAQSPHPGIRTLSNSGGLVINFLQPCLWGRLLF